MTQPTPEHDPDLPVVLCFSGHDPSGGAGIQADIETLVSHGCHPASVITCLTVQNTQDVYKLLPLSASDILEQTQCLLEDLPIAAIKIGLLGSLDALEAVETVLKQLPNTPTVLDPVLASGATGTPLVDQNLLHAIRTRLLPYITLVTPNRSEAMHTKWQRPRYRSRVLLYVQQ